MTELNNTFMNGEGPQMIKSGNKARFGDQDSVRITVFANGILVKSGPFRPYTDPKTMRFVKDVIDGYFPAEFKHEYVCVCV